MEDDTGDLVGVGGAEIYGRFALLRSLAVRADHRGAGWGERITRRVIEDTRHAGVGELFLLTTTAERYFASRGWEVIPRLDVPEVIAATAEFATLCPSTAIVMRRSL